MANPNQRNVGPIGRRAATVSSKISWFDPTRSGRPGFGLVGVVYFETGSAQLAQRTKAPEVLDSLAAYYHPQLAANQRVSFLLVGYADRRGSERLNARLSKRRADAVAAGIESRLSAFDEPLLSATTTGHGETFASDEMDADRRVEIREVSFESRLDQLGPYRRLAEQAIERHTVGVANLQRQIDYYERMLKELGVGTAGYNLENLKRYSERQKRLRARYDDLLKAVSEGKASVAEWSNKNGDGASQVNEEIRFYRELIEELRRLRESVPRDQYEEVDRGIQAAQQDIQQAEEQLEHERRQEASRSRSRR